MGTLYHKSLSLIATGGLSYTEQVALQDEVQARRAEAAQLRAQIMLEQAAANDASWQRHGNDDTELLIRYDAQRDVLGRVSEPSPSSASDSKFQPYGHILTPWKSFRSMDWQQCGFAPSVGLAVDSR